MLGRNTSTKLGQRSPSRLGDNVEREGGWQGAIADAERKISETKARLARLKAALAFCRERLESGDPFPGDRKSKSATFGSS